MCSKLWGLYLFLAVLSLHCCCWAISSCGKWGLLSSFEVRASPRGGFSPWGAQALGSWVSAVVEHRLRSCSSWAWLLCGMWGFPGPGIEPMSPAVAGRWNPNHWTTKEVHFSPVSWKHPRWTHFVIFPHSNNGSEYPHDFTGPFYKDHWGMRTFRKNII